MRLPIRIEARLGIEGNMDIDEETQFEEFACSFGKSPVYVNLLYSEKIILWANDTVG